MKGRILAFTCPLSYVHPGCTLGKTIAFRQTEFADLLISTATHIIHKTIHWVEALAISGHQKVNQGHSSSLEFRFPNCCWSVQYLRFDHLPSYFEKILMGHKAPSSKTMRNSQSFPFNGLQLLQETCIGEVKSFYMGYPLELWGPAV